MIVSYIKFNTMKKKKELTAEEKEAKQVFFELGQRVAEAACMGDTGDRIFIFFDEDSDELLECGGLSAKVVTTVEEAQEALVRNLIDLFRSRSLTLEQIKKVHFRIPLMEVPETPDSEENVRGPEGSK